MPRPIAVMRGVLRLVAAALLVAACAGPAATPVANPTGSPGVTPTTAAPRVTVTLGIYSGRPDPSWDLTAAEAAAVVNVIDRLPTVTATPPEGGLGYHGFTLLIRRAGEADATLIAYRGTVASPGAGLRPYLADPGRTLERQLLDAGRSALTPDEIAVVEADLHAGR